MTDAGHKAVKALWYEWLQNLWILHFPKCNLPSLKLKPHIPSINNLDDINVIS